MHILPGREVLPHQVALVALLRAAYLSPSKGEKAPDPPSLPLASFILDRMYDLNEPDASYDVFSDRLAALEANATQEEVVNLVEAGNGVTDFFNSLLAKRKPDQLIHLYKDFQRRLCTEREDEDHQHNPAIYAQNPVDRRSPFGVFARQKVVDFNRLSYTEMLTLLRSTLIWAQPADKPIDHSLHESDLGLVDVKRQENCTSSTQWNSALAFDEYHISRQNGHTFRAHQALRQFFDYRSDGPDKNHYQHALINLAALHVEERGYEQARLALIEAIRVAKQHNDKSTITSCLALTRRINFLDPQGSSDDLQTEAGSPEPHYIGAQDHLWQAREAIRLGKPVNLAMASLYKSKAKLGSEVFGFRFDRFKIRWEAVSSELWSLLGSRYIADVHRQTALDPEPGLTSERAQQGSLASLLSAQAQDMAHRGLYDQAVVLILSNSSVESRLPKSDFDILHAALYKVWRIQASRGGYAKLEQHVNAMDAALVRDSPVEEVASDSERRVYALLAKAKRLRAGGNPAAALHEVLEALTLSEYYDPPDQELNLHRRPAHGRTFPRLHLSAQVLLAEIELSYFAADKSRKLLRELQSRVCKADDPALLAAWHLTYAKALQAGDAKEEAISHFKSASALFTQLDARQDNTECLGDHAVLLNAMQRIDARNQVLEEWNDVRSCKDLTSREEAVMRNVLRTERWMAQQNAQLCVEKPVRPENGMAKERAVYEWEFS